MALGPAIVDARRGRRKAYHGRRRPEDKEHMKKQALPLAMFAFGLGTGSALAAWALMASPAAARKRPS